jgi:antitoxin (DNA-binding transcriptional repressor) of toxin-antitoxin stability system
VLIDSSDLISITEASRRGASALVRDAELGRERIVLRNNKPVAAVVSMARLEQLHELEEELRDIALTSARMLTDSGQRHSLDDVLARLGYTREQLDAIPD